MEQNMARDGDWIVSGHAHEFTNAYFPAEMLEIYPQQIVRAGIQDVWQRKPVSLEVCYTVAGLAGERLRRRLHPGSSFALACEHGEH